MAMLEKLDWVKRMDEKYDNSATWYINPMLVTMFADYRAQIEEARERRKGRFAVV
jgi:hypothetical protein